MTPSLILPRARGATSAFGPASSWPSRCATMAVAVSLAACGGGGGTETTPGGGGNVSVSGKVTYDAVPFQSGGSLNYNGTTQAPIRGATVQLVDAAGNVVGSTTSNAQGDYTLGGSAGGQLSVRVLAELKGSNYDFAVRDNTDGSAMWGMESAPFAAGAGVTQNVHATSGWSGSGYNAATRLAGPFAILDVAYLAKEKIAGVASSQVLSPLTIYWSPNNRPVVGTVERGEIGTSYFSQTANGDRALFILGAENSDTDEYDNAVIAHEIGHYLQSVISRDDSVGGPHSGNELLDMRVAFSEGWGNAWSGMVRDNPVYWDSRGARQASGFAFSVATVPSTQGWYSEGTVEYLLWGHYADTSIGLSGIYTALADMIDAPYASSIFSFNQALRTAVPGAAGGINSRAAGVDVNGTDGYGTGETNSGGLASAIPVYREHTGAVSTHCVTRAVGSPNKLGNFVYVKFAATGSRTISVQRSNTVQRTDPDLRLITSQGQVSRYVDQVDNVQTTPSVSLPSGTHVLVINDYFLFDSGATGQRCFDVRVN